MLNVLNIIALVMIAMIAPFSLWLAYFGYKSAIAEPREYPEAEAHKIAVIICARNEEKVIRRSVESFVKQSYPDDKYRIFVVAHNCTDDTAAIADAAGAEVVICNDLDKTRKADAINAGVNYVNYLGEGVREEAGYEYLVIFDADGIAEPDYLEQMNRALSAGADIAQEYIIPNNFGPKIISKLAGILYMQLMEGNAKGLDSAGLPVTLYGCGFALKSDLVRGGWHTETLVEDFECMVKEVLKDRRIVLAERARARVEVPVDFKTALRQRQRWTIGDAQCTRLYLMRYAKNLRRLGLPGIKVCVELLMIPLMMLMGYGVLLEIAVIAYRGISTAALITLTAVLLIIYLTFSIIACSVIRRYGYTLRGNVTAVLLSPLWASVMVVFAMQSLLVRDIKWKKMPRL